MNQIAETGALFWAQSDREWTLDGAAVQVSMVGFDDGSETTRELVGLEVSETFTNLRSGETDVTRARRLAANLGISFMGDTKGGPFDILESQAKQFLASPNPDGRPNSDVVRPWINGSDITRRSRHMWIIDFPPGTSMEEAALYKAPFEYVVDKVKPSRLNSKREAYAEHWWLHMEPRPGMRAAISERERYIATSRVSKHRLFVWVTGDTLPDSRVIMFARDAGYFLGVLSFRIHGLWAKNQGTQLESRPRYTHSSTFETFPFPEPTCCQRAEIAKAANNIDALRQGWLSPPSDDVSPSELRRRTLTNIYNAPPTWLRLAHRSLDEAVSAAYGWPADLADGEIVARLLDLNLKREALK